jgi:hypothetical protein
MRATRVVTKFARCGRGQFLSIEESLQIFLIISKILLKAH